MVLSLIASFGPFGAAIAVLNVDGMPTVEGRGRHYGFDSGATLTDEPVDGGAHQEPCAERRSRAEQLVDVAFPVPDMDKALGSAKQLRRLAHVFQPADAFLGLNGNARRVDVSLQRRGALAFVAGPKRDGADAQRQPFGRDGKARMHENAAGDYIARAAVPVTAFDGVDDADLFWPIAIMAELGCVVEHQQRPVDGLGSFSRRLEMTAQNIVLVDALIGQKTIGRFRIGPICAC